MQTRQKELFTTIKSEGGLLPLEYLRKVESFSKDIKGITSAEFHLIEGEAILQKISSDWARAQTAWTSFKKAREKIAGDQTGTAETREKWLLPLFTILEYGRLEKASYIFEDKTYPISHAWRQIPIHFVGCGVSIDKKQKGATGTINSSPYSTVQEFLNKSKDHLWGIVSNGLVLRLLRDNVSLTRQAYIEFDLEIMFDNEIYSDFKVLWLLCHQSRFEGENPAECIMEQWVQQARTQGTRMLEDLRNGVESAIAALGSGFIDHSSNTALRASLQNGTLDKQDFYRQLLRLVYRFIFLFTAEDRDVLFRSDVSISQKEKYLQNYSTRRLRRLAGKIKGTAHEDLWESFRITMSILGSKGDTTLGLPALGSMLWSIDAIRDLHLSTIANSSLLDAVRALAYTVKDSVRLTVDYRNMGTEELGSVYEALLELHPDINTETGRFELKSASGNERKTTGSYYTPSSLINCLLDSALEPVLNEAAKQADPEKAILNLKICDPACGSGHFLIAAAHRMAKRLASIRTNEEEPPIEDVRHALRDIISRCIYGVDINPMSVELCKVSLWMEAMEPGKPLSFVDHHIRCGNSLLGTTPALIAKGIPEAAFEPIEGDDKKICTVAKKRNKKEREGQQLSMLHQLTAQVVKLGNLTQSMVKLDDMNDDSIDAIDMKQRKYQELINSQDYLFNHLLADSWCSAFVMKKDDPDKLLITHDVFKRIEANPFWTPPVLKQEILELRNQYQFFHWHLEFPDVFRVPGNNELPENEQCGWSGGFNCVLGNPPWEKLQSEEIQWFAQKDANISAMVGKDRKFAIDKLQIENASLWKEWKEQRRYDAGTNLFIKQSGKFPLTGAGKFNTYSIFSETFIFIIKNIGTAGLIVPTGIATDDNTKLFFQHVVENESLISLYDFENKEAIFEDVHRSFKFCLLSIGNTLKKQALFGFFLHDIADLTDKIKIFTLTKDDIHLINPNTRTCPTFRSKIDAELTKSIYKLFPIIDNEFSTNPWTIKFRRVLNETDDSDDFIGAEEVYKNKHTQSINNQCAVDNGNLCKIYEAKQIWQYDHRYATYDYSVNHDYSEVSEADHLNPEFSVLSKYFYPKNLLQKYYNNNIIPNWQIVFRRITNATNERTLIFTIIPQGATGTLSPLAEIEADPKLKLCFVAEKNSFIFDYIARQKISGTDVNLFKIKQLPSIPPSVYHTRFIWSGTELREWLSQRAIELFYTSFDMRNLAVECGYHFEPFLWNKERRHLIRCEIDAAYFHLYNIDRGNVEYILDTFPITKNRELDLYNEYRTKKLILNIYDSIDAAIKNHNLFKSELTPPPGDIRCTHNYQERIIAANPTQKHSFPWEGREKFLTEILPHLISLKPNQSFEYYLKAALLLSNPKRCTLFLNEDADKLILNSNIDKTGDYRLEDIQDYIENKNWAIINLENSITVPGSNKILPLISDQIRALIPLGIKAIEELDRYLDKCKIEIQLDQFDFQMTEIEKDKVGCFI